MWYDMVAVLTTKDLIPRLVWGNLLGTYVDIT